MIELPENCERAILVHIDFPNENIQEDLDEFKELVRAAGASIAGVVTGARQVPEAKYFIGVGKAEEVRTSVVANHAQVALFNHSLTPAQERNLEKLLQCRVLDRTGLILDIFAQRARSFEGKLQVELALLKHLSTRLVRGWTHLERQRGGIGLRGPGETQLETDRRLIRNRIKLIAKRLLKVREQREQGRRARQKAIIPTVALVGYTNAGKSTLFNRLSGAEVFVANQLFATLDPTLRRILIPEFGPVILADTVGFIRHLPHDLVEAFRATLEEVAQADLLLHVVDMHDEKMYANIEQVNSVLKSIGADEVPQILVYNKMDLFQGIEGEEDLPASTSKATRVLVSAKEGMGILELHNAIKSILGKDLIEDTLILKPEEVKLRATLYNDGVVRSEYIDEEGNSHLEVQMSKLEFQKIVEMRLTN